VRAFSIFMDDIMPSSDQDPDGKGYQHYAELHCDICNRLYGWLQALSPECTLSMCPIDYHGTAPFSNYLRALGEGLHPQIDIFYTGPEICSPTITTADAQAFADVVRRPPLIWDNYPANDLTMRSELHIGPVRGRSPDLAGAVKGIIINPMIQAEASKIPLLTFAEYFRDPASYDPEWAWEQALREIGGWTSYPVLREFAENARHSCLEPVDAPKLEELVHALMSALESGQRDATGSAAQVLGQYLNSLDESCYYLKNRIGNLRLREDLLPWILALEDWVWLGKRALLVLEAIERGEPYQNLMRWIEQSFQEISGHNKRIGGRALLPLAAYVREQVERRTKSVKRET
jgi:hyaluronoglucosaminidase